MNETLRRALLRAGIRDEDVAARLQIDPKTVRRWLGGRLPYPRHRWALAGMLGVEEADLWPALRAARARPAEVRAIYPRLDAVPQQVWLDMFMSAEQGIDILAEGELCFARDPAVMAVLASRACAGVRTRICVLDPGPLARAGAGSGPDVAGPLMRWEHLLQDGTAQVRQCRTPVYHWICRADGHILISQHAQGAPPQSAAVLQLAHTTGADMSGMYLAEFERIWAQANPAR